ncbi:hypothetical protein B296_00042261, partial [Ensete ventricosum]
GARPTFPQWQEARRAFTARTMKAATKYDDMVSNKHSKDLRYGCHSPPWSTCVKSFPWDSHDVAAFCSIVNSGESAVTAQSLSQKMN